MYNERETSAANHCLVTQVWILIYPTKRTRRPVKLSSCSLQLDLMFSSPICHSTKIYRHQQEYLLFVRSNLLLEYIWRNDRLISCCLFKWVLSHDYFILSGINSFTIYYKTTFTSIRRQRVKYQ